MGVGFEYGFAPNWSFGVEYDHLFMGDANNSFSVVNPISAAFVNNRISQDVDMVTVRSELPLRRLRGANSGPLLISLRQTGAPAHPCRGFFYA